MLCPRHQAKFCHFGKVDGSKYTQLWRMQQQEACSLVQQLLAADRVIHEQQLGWQWQPPDGSLLASPHDVQQANSPTATGAAAHGGDVSAAGSRQVSISGGQGPVLNLGSAGCSRSDAAWRASAVVAATGAAQASGSRRGSSTSTSASQRASSTTGAAGGAQLHIPPEVRFASNGPSGPSPPALTLTCSSVNARVSVRKCALKL